MARKKKQYFWRFGRKQLFLVKPLAIVVSKLLGGDSQCSISSSVAIVEAVTEKEAMDLGAKLARSIFIDDANHTHYHYGCDWASDIDPSLVVRMRRNIVGE